MSWFRIARAAGSLWLIVLPGCVLTPRGTADERERLAAAGEVYERRSAEELPDPGPSPDWRALLHRAFLANGELEAAYFDWKAALKRIDIAAGWPNTNVSLGYEYMFSPGRMKAWDRSTVSIGFDPMQNLSLPPKVIAQGHVALEEARAVGKRFEAAKFALQRRLLEAYFDLAATRTKRDLAGEDATLTGALGYAASAQFDAGAQLALARAGMARAVADDDVARLETELRQKRALLNALAARDPGAPLELPPDLEPRALAASDDALLAVAVDNNPELAVLAREVAGREDALDLARLQYLPDINPFAAFTGNSIQVAGIAVTLATQIPQIWAGIDQAEALLRGSRAMLAQQKTNRAAEFVAALYGLRDAERQSELLQSRLLPSAIVAQQSARIQYETGSLGLTELIEAERAPLRVRALLADAGALREARLAELEQLAGVDFETLAAEDQPIPPNMERRAPRGMAGPSPAGRCSAPPCAAERRAPGTAEDPR